MLPILKSIWKEDKRKILTPCIIAILTGLIGLLFSLWQTSLKNLRDKDSILYSKTTKYTLDSIHYITETTEQRMTIKEFKKLHERDSLAFNNLNIKLRNTEHIINAGITLHGNFIPKASVTDTVVELMFSEKYDTLKVYKDYFTDGYLTYNRVQIENKEPSIIYSYKDKLLLNINRYHNLRKAPNLLPKLRTFLGKKKDYKVNAVFSNPLAKVDSLEFITIKK